MERLKKAVLLSCLMFSCAAPVVSEETQVSTTTSALTGDVVINTGDNSGEGSIALGYASHATKDAPYSMAGGQNAVTVGRNGFAWGQKTEAGENSAAFGEDVINHGFRSFAAGSFSYIPPATDGAPVRGVTVMGGDGHGLASYTTVLGSYGKANLPGQHVISSGSLDQSASEGGTGQGSNQLSTLILRGETDGSAAVFMKFGPSGNIMVHPFATRAAYLVRHECIAAGNGGYRAHVERFIADVNGDRSDIQPFGTPEDSGELPASWSVVSSAPGWYTLYRSAVPSRVTCTETYTNIGFL